MASLKTELIKDAPLYNSILCFQHTDTIDVNNIKIIGVRKS